MEAEVLYGLDQSNVQTYVAVQRATLPKHILGFNGSLEKGCECGVRRVGFFHIPFSLSHLPFAESWSLLRHQTTARPCHYDAVKVMLGLWGRSE